MTTFPSNLQLRDSEREAEEGCSVQSQSTQISSQSAEEITETTAGPSVAGNQSVQPSLSHQRITTPTPPEASINSPQSPQALYQTKKDLEFFQSYTPTKLLLCGGCFAVSCICFRRLVPCCSMTKDGSTKCQGATVRKHQSAVRSISVAVKGIGDGLQANYGIRPRSMAANPCHLSVNETPKKIEDFIGRIEENQLVQFSSRPGLPLELADLGGKDYAFDIINYFLHNQMPCKNAASHFPEIKRAQMMDWIFWISRVAGLPDESHFLAVHLLDKALVDKNISEMSSVDVGVVMVEVVKIAGKFELGPECENGMWDRLKSVVCNPKLQCQEDKINQWESQLLKFFDFAISRKHLLHFLHIFWLLMGDVMSETEKENGWASLFTCFLIVINFRRINFPSHLVPSTRRKSIRADRHKSFKLGFVFSNIRSNDHSCV
ncbi:unnamed protein product, partial [Mesorhabditis belari]|uniref:Cyclin N-terminal domain-containing protein n=1 Tax=Mesorhabditis belari TaxID=2138241 RepID=A0AAF3FEV0_9BILA